MAESSTSELVTSHCIPCRGVRLDDQQQREPALQPEDAVQAVIDKYRDGTTRITCPKNATVFGQAESCDAPQRTNTVFPTRCAYSTLPEPESSDCASASVQVLVLSVRAKKCLERARITSIRQLAQRLADPLDDIWNVGTTVLDEFKEQLAVQERVLNVETVEQG